MNNPMLDFLRADGSIVVNKKLCHAIGMNEAVLYSELVSKHFYFYDKKQLDDDGYFFNVSDNLFVDTSLSYKQQKNALDKLQQLGLVLIKIKGIPARKYFKINQDLSKLGELMSDGKQIQQLGKKVKTCIEDKSKLDVQKQSSNNTNLIIQKKNTKDYIVLTQNDGNFISFYLSIYYEFLEDRHPTLSQDNYYKLIEYIQQMESDINYETWCDAVIEHFENLPKSNNGSIIAFMTASDRYFL